MRLNYLIAAAAAGIFFIASPAPASEATLAPQIVATAAAQCGVPYVSGGSTRQGFDCSGLVKYVFSRAAHTELPHSAIAQYALGTPVEWNHARPGDLLFFHTEGGGGGVTHVGIYMGHDRMVHAPRPGKKVEYASLGPRSWFRPRLLGIRRVGETYQLARVPRGWEAQAVPHAKSFVVAGQSSHQRFLLASR